MKLKTYTDYALRTLMHLAARPERLSSIAEIARIYGMSHNHLTKVVHDLRKEGYLAAVRGRSGGIRLACPAAEIRLGEVVRHTEADFDLVDCGSCVIGPGCELADALHEALDAFMRVLDSYSLEDLVKKRRSGLRELFARFDAEALPTP